MEFFISYARADQAWAEWIAWQLESAGHRTVVQAWDFRPGENFILDMQKAAAAADHTIAVLSEDYLASAFSAPEWAAALARDPTGAHRILMPVRVRPCNLTGLLSQVIYIDMVGLGETAAHNTLLNSIVEGRAKPLAQPAFPGDRRDRGAGPAFPGSAPVRAFAVGSGLAAGAALAPEPAPAIHVGIQCPQTVLGIESMPVRFTFTAEAPGTGARVVFTQNDFVISDHTDNIADEFHFDFPGADTYERELRIRAKESRESNHVMSVLCEDNEGRVLTRNSYIIRVSEPPFWWKSAETLRALFSWGFGGGLRRIAVLLTLLIAGGVYVARWPAFQRLWAGWFPGRIPANVLFTPDDPRSHSAPWADDFSDPSRSLERWQWDPEAGVLFPNGKYLQMNGPAAVYTRVGQGGAFFDFDMHFTVTLLAGGRLEWLVRAWPVPVGRSGPRSSYQFILDARKVNTGIDYDLMVNECPGSVLAKCRPLSSVKPDWHDPCDQPRQLHFVMRVLGATIRIAGEAITPNPLACTVTPFPVMLYTGSTYDKEPLVRFGAIGFRVPDAGEKVALRLVSILAPDKWTEKYFEGRQQ
jgi:hypothetical protein